MNSRLARPSLTGEYWNEIAEVQDVATSGALWRSHSDSVNADLITRRLSHSGNVAETTGRLLKTDLFDEAFGEGLYPLLQKHTDEIWAIDVSPQTVHLAQARYPSGLRGITADVRQLPFADAFFDTIVSNSTLDHFPLLEEVKVGLCELRRVLRPGGELLLTMDNLCNPVIALRNALPIQWLNRSGIVPYYVGATCTLSQLKRMLKDCGFAVQETDAILHCPRVWAVALSHWLEHHCSAQMQKRFLQVLMRFERLASLPTRYWTGHFIAVRAIAIPTEEGTQRCT